MMRVARGVRAVVAVAALAGASLTAPTADAAGYTISIHIDGIAGADGAGNYVVRSFQWGEPGVATLKGASPEITFVHMVDKTSGDLFNKATAHQAAKTAELKVLAGTNNTTVMMDIKMTDVHFQAVRESASIVSTDAQPEESVTLKFGSVDYSFVNVVGGQPVGPPSTFHGSF